jgi:hypothetical protein
MTGSMPGPEHNLRSLRDRPFELLKELEKRSRNVGAGSAPESPSGQEWVGVAFRMGGETFLVAREETREVLGYPAAVTRIPGAKSWVKGLANIRGQLMPMLDLRQFLGSGTTTPGRNSRRTGGGRGAGVQALHRIGVQCRAAADRDPVRELSCRRLQARRRGVAGARPERVGGKSEFFAGSKLTLAPDGFNEHARH